MPAKWFRCPDGERIDIEQCLTARGCRMSQRCATRPFLRLIGYDRKWQGVSPSSAGNGPRMLYLKATVQYEVEPGSRVWAAIGTGTHGKLAVESYTQDVLSEEPLSDGKIQGIADVLEEDEDKLGQFILSDYKTWGSYKVAKSLGIVSETVEETVLNEEGKPVILKSGPNKGQPKTRQRKEIHIDPSRIDLRDTELQLNRYRILFEASGFPVSRLQVQAIPRDGGTYVAEGRGVTKNLYLIPIKRLPNKEVLDFYRVLAGEVTEAFKVGYARKCSMWETWEGRRCEGYCEVVEECKAMSAKAGERWGII